MARNGARLHALVITGVMPFGTLLWGWMAAGAHAAVYYSGPLAGYQAAGWFTRDFASGYIGLRETINFYNYNTTGGPAVQTGMQHPDGSHYGIVASRGYAKWGYAGSAYIGRATCWNLHASQLNPISCQRRT